MNVVLVHPVHGAKVAINQTEIEMDEKNGWQRYNPEKVPESPIEDQQPTQGKRKYTRRNANALTSESD